MYTHTGMVHVYTQGHAHRKRHVTCTHTWEDVDTHTHIKWKVFHFLPTPRSLPETIMPRMLELNVKGDGVCVCVCGTRGLRSDQKHHRK